MISVPKRGLEDRVSTFPFSHIPMAWRRTGHSASAQDRLVLPALFPVQTRSWGPELSSTGPEGSFQTNAPKQSLVLVASPACTEHQMAAHERAEEDAGEALSLENLKPST